MPLKKTLLLISILMLSACSTNKATPVTQATIEIVEFSYTPSSITIPVNQPVDFTIINHGTQTHNFVIEKIALENLEIGGDIANQEYLTGDVSKYDLQVSTIAGGTSTLHFMATEPGEYKIFCTVQGHETAGMVGKLIVVSQ